MPSSKHIPLKKCLRFSLLFLLDGDRLQSKIITPNELPFKPDTRSIFIKPYRIPFIFHEEIEKTNLLHQSIFYPSKSFLNLPLLMVLKRLMHQERKNIEWLLTTIISIEQQSQTNIQFPVSMISLINSLKQSSSLQWILRVDSIKFLWIPPMSKKLYLQCQMDTKIHSDTIGFKKCACHLPTYHK